jgi:hypothetical protein
LVDKDLSIVYNPYLSHFIHNRKSLIINSLTLRHIHNKYSIARPHRLGNFLHLLKQRFLLPVPTWRIDDDNDFFVPVGNEAFYTLLGYLDRICLSV